MHFDFPTILVLLTFGTGLIWVLDGLILRRKRKAESGEEQPKKPLLIELSRDFFPVFLVVLLLRSFVIEPFRIPSGSMIPTLLIGDFILVNKYAYGLRLPVLDTKILDIGEPKRGDVIVFRFPGDPRKDYIKRVVGLPGDRIDYKEKTVYVNGEPQMQTTVGQYEGEGAEEDYTDFVVRSERLGDVEHQIMINPMISGLSIGCNVLPKGAVTVPEGHYFAMGDNRDNSNDSRCWGFVPEANLRGRAIGIWMNWDWERSGVVDWSRIGMGVE